MGVSLWRQGAAGAGGGFAGTRPRRAERRGQPAGGGVEGVAGAAGGGVSTRVTAPAWRRDVPGGDGSDGPGLRGPNPAHNVNALGEHAGL